MDGKRIAAIVGVGCFLLLLVAVAIPVGFLVVRRVDRAVGVSQVPAPVVTQGGPTLPTPAVPSADVEARQPAQPSQPLPGTESGSLIALYQDLNPGVVNITVQVSRGFQVGQGAGSGFILDTQGHIVTNSHVVAGADRVVVIFYSGVEAEAEVIGTDEDSDLAVVKVDQLVEGAHPLVLGDSDQVRPGEWVVAIGNPFGQQSSMTIGIVSAVGRTIPSLTAFGIPQAIQTDAAINPGNSGGPLLNLRGEVIGVNAQIQSGGIRANAGVGFAIPSNIVRLVVPALIEEGFYTWPWLGVSTLPDISPLTIMKANELDTQQGAYIVRVVPNSPADEAGLRGASRTRVVDGIEVPVGGDMVVEADGRPITNFSDLLAEVALRKPGDEMKLTILRDGQRRQVTVTLAPRPANLIP